LALLLLKHIPDVNTKGMREYLDEDVVSYKNI
jgi:hypothetical protein